MVTFMNQYISTIHLQSDDITKNILHNALMGNENVQSISTIIRNSKFIVDIKLKDFSVDNVITLMNLFICNTSFPYSSLYLRFNEGDQIRYRYASCKENKEGFCCDIVFS